MVRPDQQRVRSLLAEAVTILCKNTLAYEAEFQVEGLIGITVDQREVFLVNIKEYVGEGGGSGAGATAAGTPVPTMGSPRGPRPMVNRPQAGRSPFMPKRTFGVRGRGRGRGFAGLRTPIQAPRATVQPSPADSGGGGEPPEKRAALESASPTTTISAPGTPIVKQEVSDLSHDVKTEQNGANSATTSQASGEGSDPNDPLSTLDFDDMMKHYENPTGGEGQSSHSVPSSDSPALGPVKQEIPDPMTSEHYSQSGLYGQAGPGLYSPGQSGMYSAGGMMSPGQYGRSGMPGTSGWPQSVPASIPVSPRSKPAVTTPRRSGPGRPSAAAGSPAQVPPGSSTQDNITQQGNQWLCMVCGYCTQRKVNCLVHIKNRHEKSVLYRCRQCLFQCNWLQSLKRHVMTQHGGADSNPSDVTVKYL